MCTPSTTLGCNSGDQGSPCGINGADCCITGITAPIVSQNRLQGINGGPNIEALTIGLTDNIRIVRLIGDIWIRDVVNYEGWLENCTAAGSNTPLKDYVENYALLLRVGLHKAYATQAGDDGTNPAFDNSNPAFLQDWTEGRWLYLRQVYWEPHLQLESLRERPGGLAGVCADVTGGANNIVPAEASGSQPTYTIDTRVSTSCNLVNVPDEGACPHLFDGYRTGDPPLFHFRFTLGLRSRRGLRLRRDEQLNLQIGWSHPVSTRSVDGLNKGWGCACATDPDNGRCFEQSQVTAHMCARAIVQMN